MHLKSSDYSGGSYSERYTVYDLIITEQMKYVHLIFEGNGNLFMLWSAAIDMQNKAVLQQAEDIIFNKMKLVKLPAV